MHVDVTLPAAAPRGARLRSARPFDVMGARRDFPGLALRVHGKPLVYLDNAATAQKPQAVIDAQVHAYTDLCANVNRGVHALSYRATEAFEASRAAVSRFIGAAAPQNCIFVRGTTEAINLVAHCFGRSHVGQGDTVLISAFEHHANIVPWQMLCKAVGARLAVIPMDKTGTLDLDAYQALLKRGVKLVAVSHVSNALGTVNPAAVMVRLAHAHGATILLDGAQAVPHMPVDVQALDCDFYAFSAHKMFGPTGVGVLYGRAALLEAMPPYQGGGDMISSVTFAETTYNAVPHKFEAGTPDIAGVLALHAAIDYIRSIGLQTMQLHEAALLQYATKRLLDVPGVRVVGTAANKASVLSFTMDDIHPHDIGTVLDKQGIAIRTGHHCAQPAMAFFGVAATARASFAFYNTMAEIDALASGLHQVREMFS